MDLIKKNNVRSLAELLPLLPAEMRASYVLMKASESAQNATKEYPRVIMASTQTLPGGYLFMDGNLLLAFSGDSKDRNHNLEIIEFDPQENDFNFYNLRFPVDWATNRVVASDVQVMETNTCISCHGSTPRPNFPRYNFWPNSSVEKDEMTSVEEKYLKYFALRQGIQHVLYSALDHKTNFELNGKDRKSVAALPFKLDSTINDLNNKRVVGFLKKTPDYDQFKYAIVASLIGCRDIPSFLPKDLGVGKSVDWRVIYKDTQKAYNAVHAITFPMGESSPYITANLRYLLESRGVDISNWGTMFNKPYVLDTTAVSLIEQAKLIYKNDADFSDRYVFKNFPINGESIDRPSPELLAYCAVLKEQSIEVFADK